MRVSLPRASSVKASASCEPMESPSGRAWEVSRKRWRFSSSSRICRRTGSAAVAVVVWLIVLGVVRGVAIGIFGAAGRAGADLLQDALDAVSALDRFVEEEFELGHAFQPEAASD